MCFRSRWGHLRWRAQREFWLQHRFVTSILVFHAFGFHTQCCIFSLQSSWSLSTALLKLSCFSAAYYGFVHLPYLHLLHTFLGHGWHCWYFLTDPDEMIYDDVELGEEGGGSSLDNGWSSSEFESYDEASDGEGRPENGMPHAFMRGKPPQRKTHVCIAVISHITFPLTTV